LPNRRGVPPVQEGAGPVRIANPPGPFFHGGAGVAGRPFQKATESPPKSRNIENIKLKVFYFL
jgi:hypothetical protein